MDIDVKIKKTITISITEEEAKMLRSMVQVVPETSTEEREKFRKELTQSLDAYVPCPQVPRQVSPRF